MNPILPPRMMMPTPIMPVAPMIGNVILTSTSQFTLVSNPANYLKPPEQNHMGLFAIKNALRESGFENVSIYDSGQDSGLDIESDAPSIIERFKLFGAEEKGAVIGVSTTTDEYFRFPALVRLLREEFPDALIIAGGVHFVRESIGGYYDPVEKALHGGLADAVQVGHAQGFIELILEHNGRIEDVTSPGFYRLDPKSGEIVGKGEGRFVRPNHLPYILSRNDHTITLTLRDTCRNKCDFCSVASKQAPLFPVGLVISNLLRIFTDRAPITLVLNDSNPFGKGDLEYYEKIFSAIDKVNPTIKTVYLNPALLTSEEYRKRLIYFFLKYRVLGFFMGRDTVTEPVARLVGRRSNKKIKNQAQLDEEHEAILAFIREMASHDLPAPLRITTSYILTPFDTPQSAMTMVNDIMAFEEFVDDEVKWKTVISPLMPYPGTKLRSRMANLIDPDDFFFHDTTYGSISPWKSDAGPGIPLMRRILKIYREKKEMYFLVRLMYAIKEIYGIQ